MILFYKKALYLTPPFNKLIRFKLVICFGNWGIALVRKVKSDLTIRKGDEQLRKAILDKVTRAPEAVCPNCGCDYSSNYPSPDWVTDQIISLFVKKRGK